MSKFEPNPIPRKPHDAHEALQPEALRPPKPLFRSPKQYGTLTKRTLKGTLI